MTRSAPAPEREASSPAEAFPRAFWTANITELFERGAYYAMASFVVIYFGRLGMGRYWPSTLNSMLWSLVYFLPILSGTVADQVGFRKALLGAFVLLTGGYLLMGTPVWFAGATLLEKAGDSVTTTPLVAGVCVAAILLIGVGGSIVKPCISGTVQKTSSGRATLAFAIFYMVINIGSLFGRAASYYVRTHSTLVSIFGVSMTCAILAFAVVAIVYREPARSDGPARARKSVGRVLVDMVVVLKSPRFVLFLLVMVGALGPFGIPVGSLFVVATVALIALGELFAQARVFEYIGALAPKGQEGLFLGYANLPTALGALTGGPVGAYLFHDVITSTRLRCGACYGKGAASLSRDLVALDYALEL